MPGHPARSGGELAVDHQKPVVVALQHGLHYHRRPLGIGGLECGSDTVLGSDIDGDAAAMIAVERLDDDRITDSVGGTYRLVHVVDQPLLRRRQAEIGKQPVGEILVRRDFNGDV